MSGWSFWILALAISPLSPQIKHAREQRGQEDWILALAIPPLSPQIKQVHDQRGKEKGWNPCPGSARDDRARGQQQKGSGSKNEQGFDGAQGAAAYQPQDHEYDRFQSNQQQHKIYRVLACKQFRHGSPLK
jgi:hypothetical protein